MTGIAELYLCLRRPHSEDARARFKAFFQKQTYSQTRFVVLSWKRTGSNLLCGILHHHPEITMHNELFNPIDIFTYHPKALTRNKEGDRWTVLGRDLWPEAFLDHIWSGKYSNESKINEKSKAIGFKSFPDHWMDVRNEDVFQKTLLDDFRIKKIVLQREDELAVYISMKRAELTGNYMTLAYPKDLKIYIDPAKLQVFVNNYRDTFRRKYRSPMEKRNTFRVTYEQMLDQERFEKEILPLLWDFLGVDNRQPLKKLRETTKQADPNEDLSEAIENYQELEFAFRHTDILHFARNKQDDAVVITRAGERDNLTSSLLSWSLLLPICSRMRASLAKDHVAERAEERFNANRLIDLATTSQYNLSDKTDETQCWRLLQDFAASLRGTSSRVQLEKTECVVGIDIDDPVFNSATARKRICSILPCKAVFVDIRPEMYGRVCKIWNHLARKANNDFLVLLGDDILLKDEGWQERVAKKFQELARSSGLPLGAACVALRDLSFPGFPTFPVVHRWHLQKFGSLLPKQFVNQGGDPYLYELYSRFNTSAFEVASRLENTIGGDGDARYMKHDINWRGQILKLNLEHLGQHLDGAKPQGICLDVIVPSYRTNNSEILRRIALLRSSVHAYVKFWFVLDNPQADHVDQVKKLAEALNHKQQEQDCNYFVNVVHYGDNRGASYARNTGYNFSTADWALFLDDDVIPDDNILDAYIGAIKRYPDAKVFVGLTELPACFNIWTEMLRTCNIMFFYGVAKHMVHPPWGVTANLMVRGSRFNPTIQFKNIYPKTGGGEDIDFVFQFKKWYPKLGIGAVVGVSGAKATHPWWQNGKPCYSQINGWANGDSLCITEWPQKSFLTFPNWIEYIVFFVVPLTLYTGNVSSGIATSLSVAGLEHTFLGLRYYPNARRVTGGQWWRSVWVALGAGTVLSAQETTRVIALIRRVSLYSLCRRVDWNDGQQPRVKLDGQLGSMLRFVVFAAVTFWLMKPEAQNQLSHLDSPLQFSHMSDRCEE